MGDGVPEQPRLRDLIQEVLKHCSSVDEFLAKGLPPVPAQFWQSFNTLLQQRCVAAWGYVVNKLIDDAKWRGLAASPKSFHVELEKLLGEIRFLMQVQYGTVNPAHRPRKNTTRDAELYAERVRHPRWTYGQIAAKHNMRANVVREAIVREEKRKRQALEKLLNFLAWLQDELEPIQKPTLPSSPRPDDLRHISS